MFKLYFLTAFRSLIRNRNYSVLNIMGLALGITCSILLFLVIQYELSYDRFHTKAEQIYRLNVHSNYGDGLFQSSAFYFPGATVLRNNNPGFETITQVYAEEGGQITVPATGTETARHFRETKAIGFVEPEFFRMFDFYTGTQDFSALLREPNNLILTSSLADKYFPGENAVGKVVYFNNKLSLKVGAVIPDFPTNTDFPFLMLISYPTMKTFSPYELDSWHSLVSNHTAYVVLPEQADPKAFEKQTNLNLQKHMPERRASKEVVVLQPLRDIHFNGEYGNYAQRTVSREVIWSMALVGLMLVITACINFVNLATAQAIRRAKEVGIRKVMGSNPVQLMLQFIGETFLIVLLATLLSIIFAELALPYLNQLLELNVTFSIWNDPVLFLFLVLQVILVTLFAGLYPAFLLARFQPIAALRSSISVQQVRGLPLRRALVVLQFTICQVLIICTLIVNEQMHYFRNKDLGFNKEAVVASMVPRGEVMKLKALRQEILSNPAVTDVTFGMAPPAADIFNLSNFSFDNAKELAPFQVSLKMADEHYIDLFDIKLLAGRNFQDHQAEGDTVIRLLMNETLRRKLELKTPEDAIGKTVLLSGGRTKGIVVGVVEDFHQSSLRDPISPAFLMPYSDNYFYMMAKVDMQQSKDAIAHLEEVWYKAYPETVFNYGFVDDMIARFYRDEVRQSSLFKIFSFIAIFIGCLGLYGLISFMAAQRTKEIGVRKVLGASVFQITVLFSKEFAKLVLLAFVLAAPIAYYLMQLWLQDFTYRISIGYWPFLLAGAATLLIALVTMSSKAIRAAMTNPVLSLKTE